MKRRCYEEVLGLHRFFERWFGTQRQTETDLLRLSGVLAEGFWLRPPGAAVLQRAELIQSVRAQQGAYGRSDPPFRIEIERFHARGYGAETPLFRVTYEEWQTLGGRRSGRASDALFCRREGTPHGVAWVCLSESAL